MTLDIPKYFVTTPTFDRLESAVIKDTIAQGLYQGWLKYDGIADPNAYVQAHFELGYIGVRGKQRAEKTKGAYDILPKWLIVEINRLQAGREALDPNLVQRLMS